MRNVSLLVLMLFGASLCHGAEVYPGRPVRIIVASVPGSTNDQVARLISQHLSEQLGKPFIVDNRAGAGGIIGQGLISKSAPDGYTLGIIEPGFTIHPV